MKPEDKAKVQQALEFLEIISPQFPPLVYTETDRKRDEASTALRQLLEQPVQEPVAWVDSVMEQAQVFASAWALVGSRFDSGNEMENAEQQKKELRAMLTTPPAQPTDHSEQHLDMVDHADELTIAYMSGVHTGKKISKREWVGLTDEEVDALMGSPNVGFSYRNQYAIAFAKVIEAKLREKNGGAAQPADHTEEYLDMVRALERLLVVQDEPCSIDHHGYCQSHYLDNVNHHGGCRVANARSLVAKVRGKP
jgi:hypothetical protein